MAKANLKIIIDMNINLPEGDAEITQAEKNAICDRIYGYLKEIGTTSDDYEGCLAGEFVEGGYSPELTITEYPQNPEVAVYVSGGVVQGAHSNILMTVDVFDVDDKISEGVEDVQGAWNNIKKSLSIPVL